MSGPRTMYDKIWDDHIVETREDGTGLLYIDRHLVHEMLNILDERQFPADEVVAIASRRSQGKDVSYGDRTLKCQALENYDFTGTDIVMMSAGGSVSKEWSPKIAKQGAVVIDNSSTWRTDPDIPLIVPEVNADAISGYAKKNIIANPNCSTAQLVVALKPLHE